MLLPTHPPEQTVRRSYRRYPTSRIHFAPSLHRRIKPNTMGEKGSKIEIRRTNKHGKYYGRCTPPSALRYKNTRCIENHRNSFHEPHSLGVILVQDMSSPTRLHFGACITYQCLQYNLSHSYSRFSTLLLSLLLSVLFFFCSTFRSFLGKSWLSWKKRFFVLFWQWEVLFCIFSKEFFWVFILYYLLVVFAWHVFSCVFEFVFNSVLKGW